MDICSMKQVMRQLEKFLGTVENNVFNARHAMLSNDIETANALLKNALDGLAVARGEKKRTHHGEVVNHNNLDSQSVEAIKQYQFYRANGTALEVEDLLEILDNIKLK